MISGILVESVNVTRLFEKWWAFVLGLERLYQVQ